MNTRAARKALPGRLEDVVNCLFWKRYIRLHLASNLLTELCVLIQLRTHNPEEAGMMVTLKAAILRKDTKVLTTILGSLQK